MNNELNFTLITNNFNQVNITHLNVKCKTQIVGTNLITCVVLFAACITIIFIPV